MSIKDTEIKQPREKFTLDVDFSNVLSSDETIITGSFVNSYLASTNAECTGFISESFYSNSRVFATVESGSNNVTYKLSFIAYTNTGSIWEKDVFVNVRDE